MTHRLRPYRDGDGPACYAVYFDAVRNGTAPAYTAAQARAWAPSETNDGEWSHRLASGVTWVSEGDAGLLGFITLTQAGHLDLFFVRPTARPLGVAADLYDHMLDHVRNRGLTRLTTHASHLARRFLERRGWTVLDEETTIRHGVALTRFAMELGEIAPPTTETGKPRV